ncbi:MAG: dihydroneopterin aldolase [Alphaproteobacteria bacterium]
MTGGAGRWRDPGSALLEAVLAKGGGEISKIFFRDMILTIPIGIYAAELAGPQRVAINLELFLKPRTRDHGDDIANVFDYDQVRTRIRKLAGEKRHNLQETLVDRIADVCLGFDEVCAVRVASEKLDVYEDCAGVGYEVVRVKSTDTSS